MNLRNGVVATSAYEQLKKHLRRGSNTVLKISHLPTRMDDEEFAQMLAAKGFKGQFWEFFLPKELDGANEGYAIVEFER